MTEHRLAPKEKISRRASHEMILLFARHGNHYHRDRFETDADVKRAFEQNGINYDDHVQKCRNPNSNVNFFENLAGSTFTVSEGAKMAKVDLQDGDEQFGVEGPGMYTESTYWALAEECAAQRDRAIQDCSYSALQSALVNGVASIEAYVRYRAEGWNRDNPGNPLEDSAQNKVSFQDKVELWIPIMLDSKRLDRSGRNWAEFRRLQNIRDDVTIHPKALGYGVSLEQMASDVNSLRTGIGGLLIDLHMLFFERIPRVIIRMKYHPDVEVIEAKKT